MGQKNPNKVNAIVDEIVKNNSVFKLKSPIEQDKEKDSMARSINSALSVLNEVGKELVLQDLSVDPDEKFKGFIDSVGNIDISGLTKMTATIVKAKIEEAEREGLNLRTGEPVFKENNKISVVEGVLTVAVISEMIKNYDNLTFEQKNTISDNIHLLTHEARLNYFKNKSKRIEESNLDENDKKAARVLNKFSLDLEEQIEEILKSATGHEQEIIKQFIEENPNYKDIIDKFNVNRRKNFFRNIKIYICQITRKYR